MIEINVLLEDISKLGVLTFFPWMREMMSSAVKIIFIYIAGGGVYLDKKARMAFMILSIIFIGITLDLDKDAIFFGLAFLLVVSPLNLLAVISSTNGLPRRNILSYRVRYVLHRNREIVMSI